MASVIPHRKFQKGTGDGPTRPIWMGTLAFGLVTIPVKLFSCSEPAQQVRFRLLNRETLNPIEELRVDSKTGKEVKWTDVVHGVEYRRGKFVALTKEELAALPLPTARTIEVFGFAPVEEIDPIYMDTTYYLAPGEGGQSAYELFRTALEKRGRAAVGKVAIRTREHLAAIRAYDRALIMQTLFYADEVRKPEAVPDLPEHVKVHPNEVRMADQLVGTMSIDFRPHEYHSDYKRAVEALVRAKIEGKTLPEAPPAAGKVIDLQQALRESLRLRRARARAPQRRRRAG